MSKTSNKNSNFNLSNFKSSKNEKKNKFNN